MSIKKIFIPRQKKIWKIYKQYKHKVTDCAKNQYYIQNKQSLKSESSNSKAFSNFVNTNKSNFADSALWYISNLKLLICPTCIGSKDFSLIQVVSRGPYHKLSSNKSIYTYLVATVVVQLITLSLPIWVEVELGCDNKTIYIEEVNFSVVSLETTAHSNGLARTISLEVLLVLNGDLYQ